MKAILITVTVKGNRDVADVLRHTVARTRSFYPNIPNPIGMMCVIDHRACTIGTLVKIKSSTDERTRQTDLALCSGQYLLVEATCYDEVEDGAVLAALNRSFQKNLGMDAGDFNCGILHTYNLKVGQ